MILDPFTEKAFDNFSAWLVRYTDQLAAELTLQQAQRSPFWFSVIFPSAYAANLSGEVEEAFINALRAYIKLFDKLGFDTATDAGIELATKNFNDSLEIFNKNATAITARLLDGDVDDMLVLKAFAVAHRTGGSGAVTDLSKLKNFTNLGLGNTFSVKNYVEVLGSIPLKKIQDSVTPAQFSAITEQINKLYSKMSSDYINIAKGAHGEMLSLADAVLAANYIEVITGLQNRVVIDPNGQKFVRVMDSLRLINGVVKNIDNKAWSRGYLERGFKNALSVTAKSGNEANEKFGQLLRDIKDFQLKGEFETRWDFSKEIKDGGSPQITTPDQLANVLEDIIKNDKTVKNNLRKTLGFRRVEDFDLFLEQDLFPELPTLFKIESYDNVVAAIANSN